VTLEDHVLREDDPRAEQRLADGWVVVHESWGARLTVPDGDPGAALVARVEALRRQGWTITTLVDRDARSVVELDRVSLEDYPGDGRATRHVVPDEAALRRQLADGWHAYGASTRWGRLDCVTVMRPDVGRVETEFTVTRAESRGQGLATAVKAYGILDQLRRGNRTFGTGGSAVNQASRRMNESLGYVLEPRWLTLRRP
jgi:hypothetical protein